MEMMGPALVTGGGTGIGRGVVLALARRGVPVALAGRRAAPLEATARAARAYGVPAVALPVDLADPAARAALPNRARAALGPIRLLVCAAGQLAGGPLDRLAPETLAAAVAVNLLAPLELTRALLPDLQDGGAVVWVASTAGLVPQPGAAIYSGSKAGLIATAEALRYELEPRGIHLLVAYPPMTATALTRGMAAAAGLPAWPLARPAVVGERIVRALAARRPTLPPAPADRLLWAAHTCAPWLVRALFTWQQARFVRMYTLK